MAMYLNEYQKLAWDTAVYPESGSGSQLALAYASLKGAGEAGEFAEKVGKAIRDDGFGTTAYVLTEERRDALLKELGDEMWYCAAKATELGTTLEEVCKNNLAKLASRAERGLLKGDGDDR